MTAAQWLRSRGWAVGGTPDLPLYAHPGHGSKTELEALALEAPTYCAEARHVWSTGYDAALSAYLRRPLPQSEAATEAVYAADLKLRAFQSRFGWTL